MPHAVDESGFGAHHSAMPSVEFQLLKGLPRIVGSFGSMGDLTSTTAAQAAAACDLAEIRLDLIFAGGTRPESRMWGHLQALPLLFTARRKDEGGALEMDDQTREGLLLDVLGDAALVDIEVASISTMSGVISEMKRRGMPWIASFHDFKKLPEAAVLADALESARAAGASAFKLAAKLESPDDVARLASFQLDVEDFLVSTMGMGPLAPVSRLLCAQCGSVLNYGFLGQTATAPGQWDSASLRHAVRNLVNFKKNPAPEA